MDARTAFTLNAHKRLVGFGFTQGAQNLVQESLRTAQLPGTWVKTANSYNDNNKRQQLYCSQDGVWGVLRWRANPAAQAELFVSRFAAAAGVPVAPVFVQEQDDFPKLLSVIAFESIYKDVERDFLKSADYLRHKASILPFLLVLGDENDRKADNLCVKPGIRKHVCEFDFEMTDIQNAFSASAALDSPYLEEKHRPLAKRTYESHVLQKSLMKDYPTELSSRLVILREYFAAGIERMQDLSPTVTDDILDIINEQIPVSRLQRQSINDYIAMRTTMLRFNYIGGKYDHVLVDRLPADIKPWRDHGHGIHNFG